MNIVKILIFSLIILSFDLGGCSKPSPKAPVSAASSVGTKPLVSATSPAMSKSTGANPSGKTPNALDSSKSGTPAAAPTNAVSSTKANIPSSNQNAGTVQPLIKVAEPSKPLKIQESINANPSTTSSMNTSLPEKAPETTPVYTYNPEGRKDPFMAFLQGANSSRLVKTSIPLLNYSISDLKLVAVIVVKKRQFIAMVQTPDSKGYVVRPGMEIGLNHGRVHEITDHSISVEEEFTEIGGERKKRTTVLSLHPPEEGQL